MESLVANLDPPIAVSTSSRLGRMCVKSTVPSGHTETLVYNSSGVARVSGARGKTSIQLIMCIIILV